MARTFKILGWTFGVLLLLFAGAAAGGYFFLTSDYVRSQLESRAAAYSGRKTKIEKVSIDWGLTTRIHLDGVQIANSEWGKADHLFKADEADVEIRLLPLLRGNIELPVLTLRKPELHLEVNDKEQANWEPDQSPVVANTVKAVTPDNRFQMPLVGRIDIADGQLSFTDLKRKLDLNGAFSTVLGKAGAQPTAELSIKGHLENQPLAVHFVGGSAIMLRDTQVPYPVDLNIAYGGTKLLVKGTLDDPFAWKGANVKLDLSGPNLSDIYPLLGIPGPPTPPYHITGQLEREPGIWKVTHTAWHAGNSDLSGDIVIDEKQKPQHLTAKLVSDHLSFADLAPLVGATPGKRGNVSAQQKQTEQQLEANGDLFPNVPLHVERLRAMNMDVSLDAHHVVAPPYLPVTALAFRVVIQDGKATVNPLTLALAGGTLAGQMAVDAHTDVPAVSAVLSLRDLNLKYFFQNSKYFDTTQGRIDGRVNLVGHGRSLAQVMGGANGHVETAMSGGSVSDLMVSLAGLQIFDALIIYVGGDHQIPINCALGRLNFQQGNVVLDRVLLDTRKSILHVDGQVSLSSQAVNVAVKAEPKAFDLLDLNGPVQVTGKIRKPDVSIGRSFPLPHPVIGTAKDLACPALTQQLFEGTPQSASAPPATGRAIRSR